MGVKEFWRGLHEEEQRRDSKLIESLRKLNIYEQNDFEPIHDEVERQFRINSISKMVKANPNIVESFSNRDLGIRSSAEIYQSFDHQTNQDDINKAINRLNVEQSQKERKAKEAISSFAGASYFGYLKLRKWLDMPLEHPKLRPWYARYLPQIPALINPGGEVKLLEGTYNISGPIVANTNNVLICGVGNATKIFLASASNTNMLEIGHGTITKTGFVVRDIKFDGNVSGQTYVWDTDLRNCIWIKNNTDDVLIENCRFENSTLAAIATGRIVGEAHERITIRNNWFYNDFLHIDMSRAVSPGTLNDLLIERNVIYSPQVEHDGAAGDGITITHWKHAVIMANIMTDVEHNGIWFGAFTHVDAMNATIVAENIIDLTHDDGIQTSYSKYGIIANNFVHNPNHEDGANNQGIKCGEAEYNTYVEYILVEENIVYDDRDPHRMRYAITSEDVSVDVYILGNYVAGGLTGNIWDESGTAIIKDNKGYNPVGISSISVGSSEFTHTAGASPETIYISGGTVSLIKKGSTTIFTDTGHSVELEPYELCKVTYSVLPTMYKDVH